MLKRGSLTTSAVTAELEETKPGFPTSRIVAFRASQTLVCFCLLTVDSLDHEIPVYFNPTLTPNPSTFYVMPELIVFLLNSILSRPD